MLYSKIDQKEFLEREISSISNPVETLLRASFFDVKLGFIGKPSEKNIYLFRKNDVYFQGSYLYTKSVFFYEDNDEWIYIYYSESGIDGEVISEIYFKCDSIIGLTEFIKNYKNGNVK